MYKYRLHDILSIKSDIDLALDYFKVEGDLKSYNLIIKLVKYENLDNKRYQQISHGLYYSREEDCLTSSLKVLGIGVSWEIRNLLKENTEVRLSRSYKFISDYLLHVPFSSVYSIRHFIRMLIQVKLLLRNSTFLMGSMGVLDKKGIIFAGATGSGKTTVILHLMNSFPARYLCDDTVILSEGTAYSFPSRMMVRKYGFGSFIFNNYVDPVEKFKNRILDSFKGDFDIYILERSSSKYIRKISNREGINKLCNINNKLLLYSKERILSSAPYVYDDLSLFNMQRKQKDILTTFFKDANFHIICAMDPRNYIELLT